MFMCMSALTRMLQNMLHGRLQYVYARLPLLCDFKLQGRKCGAGVCAQQETDSERPEEGRKRRGEGGAEGEEGRTRWAKQEDEEEERSGGVQEDVKGVRGNT